MKIFAVDECNTTWEDKVNFYIYGGIVIEEEDVKDLVEKLIDLKRKIGMNVNRPIKWTNNRWNGEPPLDIEAHKKTKESVLKIVASSGCKIIVCLSPQRFYHTTKVKAGKVYQAIDTETQNRTHRFGIRDALAKFNLFLSETDDKGMVFADEFSQSSKTHLTEHCLNLFRGAGLDNIVHTVIQLKNEDSHLNQINDVVLGAIYYSLSEAGYNCLPLIAQNFWGFSTRHNTIFGKGFTVLPERPSTIWCRLAKERIKEKYLRLINV